MLLLPQIRTYNKILQENKRRQIKDANFVYGNATKEGETMFMTVEGVESLIDDAWCKDGVCVLIMCMQRNKKVCMPVDDVSVTHRHTQRREDKRVLVLKLRFLYYHQE